MGPESLVYPAVRTERTGRSHYHPYHSPDSFDKLRHHLPLAISVGCYTDSIIDQAWSYRQSYDVAHCMHSPPYLPNGQDAIHHSFVSPYFMSPYETESRFNEDPDVAAFSGDDDPEEYDSNAQLRSQQLNSDGTPKRPMNAFMIFARKRRPMVSSEQPTMRTGEISKILSKEWSEMSKENKQFYLDQAKKLKDTFNTRWPDYVYRRRPNNSRKRRKVGGTSNVGPARSHDAANNSDGHAEPLVDHNASGQSGDESRSQSTDTFPSPLSSQHNVLYHTPELSQVALDRSPTPAGTLPAYTTPVPAPFAPNGYVDGPTFNGYAQQGHPYGESGDGFYGEHRSTVIHASVAELDPKLHNWGSCEGAPSGVVAAASSSTPISTPLMTSPNLHPQIAYPPHEPVNWSKGAGGDVRDYEAQPMIWSSTPSIPGHHGVDGQEVPGTLPLSTNLARPNALGMHTYGNRENLFEENSCQGAYIGAGHVNQGYRSPITRAPFQGELSAPHDSTTYFEPRRWTPGEHDG